METVVLYVILGVLAGGILNTNYRSGRTDERVSDAVTCLLGRFEALRTGADSHYRSAGAQHGYPVLELPPEGRALNNEELGRLLERTAPECLRFLPKNGGAPNPTLTSPPTTAPPVTGAPTSTTTTPARPPTRSTGRSSPPTTAPPPVAVVVPPAPVPQAPPAQNCTVKLLNVCL